jgi:hypothetical protein
MKRTKIYVDGFLAAEIDTPSTRYLLDQEIKTNPLIQAALKDKKILNTVPIPHDYPQFVIVATELSE